MSVFSSMTARFTRGGGGFNGVADAPSVMFAAGRISMAVAALGTGILGIVVGDFAMQWQPVPDDVPGRTLFAYLTASVLAFLGAGLLIGRPKIIFAGSLTAVYLLWTLLLHGPRVMAEPLKITQWLAFCEILAMTSGFLVLTASLSANAAFSQWARRAGIIMFAACLPVFGQSHFAYPDFTAEMVPAWMPARLFWAYFTGICHVAAGVAILTHVLPRLSSFLLAAMMTGFVLLLHVPDVVNDPTSRGMWTMLCMATSLAGAAWLIAAGPAAGRRYESLN